MQFASEYIKLPLLNIFLYLYTDKTSTFVRTLVWNILKYELCDYFINSKIISSDVHGNCNRHCYEQ
jgi:hypothetical protein